MVTTKEPTEVGADVCVGSLIKNLGGAITSNGGYIVGREDLINLCAERLNVPGEADEVGPSLGANKSFLQGLYMAPSVVACSLKTVVLASYLLENLGKFKKGAACIYVKKLSDINIPVLKEIMKTTISFLKERYG
jgi:cystathionine beta-lyase family protein involved in aluminum resistance